jgi:hypothetical protein
MIPKNITRQHLLAAIAEIDRSEAPAGRKSRRFTLRYRARRYPPKYVVSLANRFANGVELSSAEFNGGKETNEFLRSRHFTVKGPASVQNGEKPSSRHPRKTQKTSVRRGVAKQKQVGPSAAGQDRFGEGTRHSERCKDCKRVVKALLGKLYGKVEENYRLPLGTQPDDASYAGSPHHAVLSEIFKALQQYRNFPEFVRASKLAGCDFYVPDPGFAVEFDESQHFTELRRIAIRLYPADLHFGFDQTEWLDHKLKRDNDPAYRDEQRAWYDTLKDFAISDTSNHITEPHVEFVYVVDLKTGRTRFTGKSYPTPRQEKGLLRVVDLDSHFVDLGGVSTMILGCHDLTMFNPRTDAKARGWRRQTKVEFRKIAQAKKPRWILQHPHTTVNPMTWSHAWKALRSMFPSASYLGTGCYSYRDLHGLDRRPLQSVLRATKSLDVADIVVHLAASPDTDCSL